MTELSSPASLTVGGTPLHEVTFVVLDLETTGNAPDGGGITDIGAVKVRGGEQIGQFASLINPGAHIVPAVTVLTGITELMVASAPTIEAVLPALLEFLDGAVLVAHNAPFDTRFLKAACALHGYQWPAPPVLDTATLARRLLTGGEVTNHRLGTLAAYFRTAIRPTHRAFDDACATVEVLHALIDRLGSHRAFTLQGALEFATAVSPIRRSKRHLAQGLPDTPGVYIFRDGHGHPLHIGASDSISTRVRGYFTASEKRQRTSEMIHIAERVEAVECAHILEAQVRELRMVAAHRPPYNRRSSYPARVVWLKLTADECPRLSLARAVGEEGGAYLGPFASRDGARIVAAAVHEVLPLCQCGQQASAGHASPGSSTELGHRAAPCDVSTGAAANGAVAPFVQLASGDPSVMVDLSLARLDQLDELRHHDDAARVRSGLAALLRVTIRMQRLIALTRLTEVVGARREPGGGWELAVIRHGRLVAAGRAAPRVDPSVTLAAIRATAETVCPGPGPTPCASAEESELVLDWLERPDVRLVDCIQGWSYPVAGAARFADLVAKVETLTDTKNPLHVHYGDDRHLAVQIGTSSRSSPQCVDG